MRKFAAALATALITLVASVTATGTATAAPAAVSAEAPSVVQAKLAGACNAYKVRIWSAASRCEPGTTGQHRVRLVCQVGPVLYTYYGPWVSAGSTSEKGCPAYMGRYGYSSERR